MIQLETLYELYMSMRCLLLYFLFKNVNLNGLNENMQYW